MTGTIATNMRFCRECNNMLYPKEDRINRRLVYGCRNCGEEENVEEICIYSNELVKENTIQLDIIPDDVVDDPTLQRSTEARCPRCHNNGGAYLRSHDGAKESTLGLIWVCTNKDCQIDETGNRLPSHRWMEIN